MLGELISRFQAQETGTRVLPGGDGLHPVLEVSFQGTGDLLGTETTDIGTYETVLQPDGTLFGEGQGVSMTADGATISWHGTGIGHFTGPGAVSWRGSVYFDTASEKFARLNSLVGVYEFESDATGKSTAKTYEWK
ncbi:hypothetical protein GCM10010193_43300 [Kitasatospora atroaurantiaca]|uniref:Allene oxide cyclase barrel-like domain-containing protein n=1 Tax=Kitasatospora atroaurantiaca TaxID=285545 RepID=A0A561ETR5_9ACTN|nr:DUF2961 domain-containing protein [Kitasatospora atroaurantiaca]TWE19002.1 hypothetical protein FB465_4103 [Kitasatospora atroaurantiaca]